MKTHREVLDVFEQLRLEVQDHVLICLCVQPVAEQVERVGRDQDQKPRDDCESQQAVGPGAPAEEPAHGAWRRVASQDTVEHQGERPRFRQHQSRGD